MTALALLSMAGIAFAQQAKNLRLVTPHGETSSAAFPAYTRAVEAKFDYVDAGGASLGFLVYGPGGLRLMRKDANYEGTGVASVPITGRDLMRGLAAGLTANTQELQRAAAQAAGAQRGVREYLNGVEAAVLLVRNAERLAGWSNLPTEGDARLVALATARSDLDKHIARARLLDDSDDAGLRGIAAQMASPAAAAVSAAKGFESAVKDLDLALMPTGRGTAESQAYVLSVLVDGQPASSALMWVTLPIYLPLTQQKR
jgi:hypothetical protein